MHSHPTTATTSDAELSEPNNKVANKLNKARNSKRRRFARRGLTLIEVMIATTITLLMLAALTEGFKRIGDSISENRAALEVSNRLRGVAFRLKQDLEGVTVRLTPPANPTTGQGYFQYYEGPMCDYSASAYVGDKTSSDPFTYAPAARYGDIDDIAMFTTRSGDTWHTGKVPRYILKLKQGITPSFPADLQPEVIASQYAEVIWFARPHDDPQIPNAADSVAYDDANGDGLPDVIKLHRRVLLIRPDLNDVVNGRLPSYTGAGAWMLATKDPYFGMHLPHQQCDLSIRRVVDPSNTVADGVAANSLQDLMLPQNRFAHFVRPLEKVANGYSMPLLALDNAYAVSLRPTPAVNSVLNNQSPNAGYLSGPLSEAYVLQNRSDPSVTLYGSAGNAFYENRIGEDVIASFCVGFDLRGYDPHVPLLMLPGNDGVYSGGAAGSDDIVVSPNDPGYGTAVASLAGLANPATRLAGTGEYVDLGWVRQTLNGFTNAGAIATVMQSMPLPFRFESSLSGVSLSRVGTARPFSDSLYRSGLVFQDGNAVNQFWCQMSYDSWTNAYESDGVLQSDTTELNGAGTLSGTVQLQTPVPGSWRMMADTGRDGIDNVGPGGVDDAAEWETSPPFPDPLRSIKVLMRFEEPATRQLFQETVTGEFISY
jgi:type II secretory pathway pseudopilin PulG